MSDTDRDELVERLRMASAYLTGRYKMYLDDDQTDLLVADLAKAAARIQADAATIAAKDAEIERLTAMHSAREVDGETVESIVTKTARRCQAADYADVELIRAGVLSAIAAMGEGDVR